MIYAAFTLWLFLVLFACIGVYRLWTQIVRPTWVNRVLLPGTVVSEMAYIFGSLITGGEIRRARLLGGAGNGRRRRRDAAEASDPSTEAEPRLKVLGPVIASLIAIIACAAAIGIVHALLGEPVIKQFVLSGDLRLLPREFPTAWGALWEQVERQVLLLRRMCETLARLDWLDWRVVLFVYLAACLSVRLAPVGRDLRAMLGAAVAIAAVIAVIGLISDRFKDLMSDVWPLLTYIWTNLLFLLVVTLIIRGLIGLVHILKGSKSN